MVLMLREGLFYSIFVTGFTASAMILNYAAPLGSFWQRLLNALTIPISGLMSARFLLHVREWKDCSAGGTDSTDQSTSHLPLNFSDPPTEATRASSSISHVKMGQTQGMGATVPDFKLTYLGDNASLASSFASTSSGSSHSRDESTRHYRTNSIV